MPPPVSSDDQRSLRTVSLDKFRVVSLDESHSDESIWKMIMEVNCSSVRSCFFALNQLIKLATLSAKCGLYSSFAGVLIYCVCPSLFFGYFSTLQASQLLCHIQRCIHWSCCRYVCCRRPNHSGDSVGVGLPCLGWLVEFIPFKPLTGSALILEVCSWAKSRGNPSDGEATREVFVPLSINKNGVTNSKIEVTPPFPGIIILCWLVL